MSKILVIEDSAEVRDRIVTSLGFEGFDIIEAEDGEAGVQMAVEAKPDLIICDIMMPKLDGHGTLSALRENSVTAAISFIFLSAKSQASDMREGLQLGANDYLIKPFSIADLTDAVNLRLRRREEMTAATPGAGQKEENRTAVDFTGELQKALEKGKANRQRVALFILQVIVPERIRRSLGGASVASVMTEAEGRLSRLSSSEFGPLELLGDGKFRALLVGNRLPMAANEIFAPLFACLPKPFERGGAVVNLSAAIGVALFPTHCASGEEFCVMPRQRSMPPWRNSRTAFAFITAIWNRARPSATTGRRPSFAISRRMTSKCAIASRSIAGRNAPPVFFASRHGTTPSAAWCRFSITRP